MTALCGGGTSSAKPGQEASLIYSSGLLVQVLEELALDWMVPLIPLVPLAPFVLSTFCASDPPAFSNLTTAEANALLQLDYASGNFASGLAKLPNIFANAIWNYSCECTSGSYTPPTVSQPSGTTVVVQPVAGTNAPCFTRTSFTLSYGTSISHIGQVFYSAGESPSVPTSMTLQLLQQTQSVPGSPSATMQCLWATTAGTNATLNLTVPAGWPPTYTLNIPWLGTPSSSFQVNDTWAGSGSGSGTFKMTLNAYCGDTPNQTPCCPPDAATQGYLDSILRMVTLIQRQQVPFSYILGTVHPSLTGNGQIGVQGLLGCKVMPASVPGWAGVQVGDPDTLWLDSWINWGNDDGWTAREFLRSAPYISLPPYAGQFTKLGYSLAPGLSVDITELVREA